MTLVMSSLTALLSEAWSIPFCAAKLFGYHLFEVKSQHAITQILSNLPKRSSIISDGDMRGWVCGLFYVGYIKETSTPHEKITVYLFTSTVQYEKLTKKVESDTPADDTTFPLTIWKREENYWNLTYRPLLVDMNKALATASVQQIRVLDRIVDHYQKTGVCVAFISGAPYAGKSYLSYLLAEKLGGTFCKTFDPTSPGDVLNLVYKKANPTKSNPLIIALEEVDVLLDKIHNNKCYFHKEIPTDVHNKSTYNSFMDDVDLKMYKNTIFVMTSNKTLEEIGINLDTSYLREGRTNIRDTL